MNDLVTEYRAMPWATDHLPDSSLNHRKCEIIRVLDSDANEDDVSRLLLDVLQEPKEFDLARVEAIQVVGLYVDESSALRNELFNEVIRIFNSEDEDDMLQGWAGRYVERLEQVLENVDLSMSANTDGRNGA